ncbi:MAG: type I secretion system permease/ATPase [Alphaproteobacteria bacterium]|nr:type I secretion system permease/ATPase [Alphaproteobacteria bacterium]
MNSNELDRALVACRTVFVVLFLFGLGINLLALSSPLYTMQIFDHVIASRSIDTLLLLSLVVVFAFAISAVLDGLRNAMLARLGNWLDYRLGPMVLARIVKDGSVGMRRDLASGALRDLATLKGFFTGTVIGALMDAPWSPIFVIALFALSPVLGAVGLCGAGALTGLAIINDRITKRSIAEANNQALAVGRDTEASLRNAEVIRAMDMTDAIISRWRRGTDRAGRVRRGATDRGAAVAAFSKFARIAIQSAIMGTGAYLVLQQELGSGAMMAGSILLGRALSPVENAITSWKMLVDAREARRRLTRLLQGDGTQERTPLAMPRPAGSLRLENVMFAAPGSERPVLQDISLQVDPGEVLGVIGPSAAGKSSFAKLVTGAWQPSAGQVRLDGLEVSHWHELSGTSVFGYLPQDVELFSGTIGENISRLAPGEAAAIVEAAQLAGLHETIMRMPRGYDTDIGEGGVMLSAGQRQRLGLARAIFGNPAMLVLDEPNASLDAEGEEALIGAMQALKARGTTIVVIAHRTKILRAADKLLVLRHGRIEAYGPLKDVTERLRRQERRKLGAADARRSDPHAFASASPMISGRKAAQREKPELGVSAITSRHSEGRAMLRQSVAPALLVGFDPQPAALAADRKAS